MTAFNLIVQPDAAYLITDTAVYDPTGVVLGFQGKTITLTGSIVRPCAITTTGAYLTPEIAHLVEQASAGGTDPAAMVRALPAIVRKGEAILRARSAPILTVHIAVAMFDHVSGRAAGYMCGNDGDIWHESQGYRPGTVERVNFFANVNHGAMVRRLKLDLPDWRQLRYHDPAHFDPIRDGAALLDQQRSETANGLHSVIGGQGFVTRVGRGGVETFMVAEWSDKIGQRIVPLGCGVANS